MGTREVVEGWDEELGRASGTDGAAGQVVAGDDEPCAVGDTWAGLGASVAPAAALVVLPVLVACAVAGSTSC